MSHRVATGEDGGEARGTGTGNIAPAELVRRELSGNVHPMDLLFHERWLQ